MQTKNLLFIFCILLLLSGLMRVVGALSPTSVSFHGVGVTIDLTFPEEAHPLDNIYHNLTITAYNYVNSLNITLFIYAPVNSTWQIIDPPHNILWPFPLGVNQSLPTAEINFTLPQNANGRLKCTLYVQTNQTADYPSYTFYTTYVSEPTLSEMQSLYYEMLANYTELQANYTTKLNEYDALFAKYSSLSADYTALLSNYNGLLSINNSQVATYQALLATYNKLKDDYDTLDAIYRSKLSELGALQSDYSELNSTRDSLQSSYDTLQAIYTDLNKTYIDLQTAFANLQEIYDGSVNSLNSDRIVMFIFTMVVAALVAFIIYIKRKKQEPYVVIRKETVSVNPDEKSQTP